MKKVRFAVGAFGAAPALGVMAVIPATATTHIPAPGTTAHHPAARTKTVSLQHLSVTPDAGCTGTKLVGPIQNKHYDSSTKFWWTQGAHPSACIGTVEGYVQLPIYGESYYRVRIWARSGPNFSKKYLAYHHSSSGHGSPECGCGAATHRFTLPVHRWIAAEPVQVCGVGVSFDHGTGTHQPVGPAQCATVG